MARASAALARPDAAGEIAREVVAAGGVTAACGAGDGQ
jgi:hypothetical protein